VHLDKLAPHGCASITLPPLSPALFDFRAEICTEERLSRFS
jgi:hypothetical protein